jgi:hypothetical protein
MVYLQIPAERSIKHGLEEIIEAAARGGLIGFHLPDIRNSYRKFVLQM